MAQVVKCLSTMRETQVQSLGREDPLEKEMAAHSSTIEDTIGFTLKSNSNLRIVAPKLHLCLNIS